MLDLRSVAGQVLILQIAMVVLLVIGAVAALVLQARNDSTQEARLRSLAVAETVANAPGTLPALNSANPSAQLQPSTERARLRTDVDDIVVMSPQGIRYTHRDPDLIGKRVPGPFKDADERAATGDRVTKTFTGSSGPAVNSVVPVTEPDGSVAGLVSVGITVENVNAVVDRQLPVLFGAAAAALTLATGSAVFMSRRLRRQTHGLGTAEMTRMYEHHAAVLHSVREGVLILGSDHRLLLANDEARRLLDLPPDAEHREITDLGLDPGISALLASGRDATDEVHRVGDRLLAVNHRTTDRAGGPPGSVATLRDSTELRALAGKADIARERLQLLYDAGLRIGTSLDVVRTAEELAEAAVPRFADFVTVELLDPVLRGDEAGPLPGSGAEMRRVAVNGIHDDHPFFPVGDLISFVPTTPQAQGLELGQPVMEADLSANLGWQKQDAERAGRLLAHGVHSLISVPLQARGIVLGMADFWRADHPGPFEEEDLSLAEELVGRAAVSIDNARRYTREHGMAVTLQRSLLPRGLPEQGALEVAYRYLPARAGVGGDWFDVIPLPGARVALVVGDVVGHGLHAAATMGRLRTAVHNFSSLDLPPDEILGHLDELVARSDQDEADADEEDGEGEGTGITGATCLYAIYDPASGRCSLTRAGHPEPALVRPDGSVEYLDLPANPPLGLGGLPFETTEMTLPEGSRLVLYTNGLVESRDRDIGAGLERLRRVLTGSSGSPERTCRDVVDAILPPHPEDDVALLVARTRLLGAGQIAEWEVASDPAAVAPVRADVSRRLAEWGLDEEAFTTELILSELITNAIRYGSGPIHVRLLRDRSLICEVSDGSNTSPHLRRAATTDEGGRGLFLVAQFAERWGTRYTARGKVIWTEQSLGGQLQQESLMTQL